MYYLCSVKTDKDMTYFEFTRMFPTENDAIDYIVAMRYPDGYVCPKCGCVHKNIYHQNYDHRKIYCNNCHSEFSALAGTIFENTHLDLRMWLYTINKVIISRKGVSALQIQRELGMGSYHSAWRLLQEIRKAVGKEEYRNAFEAIVEIDETYVGGKPRKDNEHEDGMGGTPDVPMNTDGTPRMDGDNASTDKMAAPALGKVLENGVLRNKRGRGTGKTPVIGIKERGTGRVHAVVANFNKEGKQLSGKQLFNILNDVCKDGTTVMTDQFVGYNILDGDAGRSRDFVHLKVDHTLMYSMGNGVHTNGIESFWAILKRGVYGVYHRISVKYMQRYVDEFCFRLNHRDNDEAFSALVRLAVKVA
jgi:transposase-like protein